MSDLVALRPGTILADDYRIERTLGAGGFGITYLAEEISLARLVTIKEYFPVDFAARDHLEDVVPRSQSSEGDYSWGLDRFLAEAQTLARFTHPNIVRVYRYFLARNTGYIVLHYENGQSLKNWLRSLGRAPRQPELDRLIEPLLGALETVHAADYLHRDIAPDNIMIRQDGAPVLIDFGSARGDIAKHSKTISALVKPGYSPYEQYATISSSQGPWTDIYSLGATLYEAVTGKRPPDAPSRMVADELIPPGDAALSSYRPAFLAAIARSLRLEINERPRTVAAWRAELMALPAPARAKASKSAPASAPPSLEPASAAPSASPPVESAAASPVSDAPPPAAVSEVLVKAKASAPSGGLAAAFLDGWRKAKRPAADPIPGPEPVKPAPRTPAKSSKPVVAKASPEQKVAAPAATRRGWFARPQSTPAIALAPPAPEPGARKATPRALRRRGSARWRALAGKLALGFVVAGAAVAMQDHLPTVRREGGSLLTSQPGLDVALSQLKGHRGAIAGVAYSPDGQHIVSGGTDGTLKIWDAQRGGAIRTIELDGGAAIALAVTRGRAATSHKDGTAALWDLDTGAKIATFKRSDASVLALAFVGRPERLVAGSQDGALTVWDAAQPLTPANLLEDHDGPIKAVAYADRGPSIASASTDGSVKLWNIAKAELVRSYRGHQDAATAVAFDADGRTLATGSSDGQIRLWSTLSNRLKRRFRSNQGSVTALAILPGGDQVVSGGSDGTVRMWDGKNGRLLRSFQAGAGAVTALGVSPDGRRLAAAGSDGVIRLWDASVPKAGT